MGILTAFDFVLDLAQTVAIGYVIWRTWIFKEDPRSLGDRRAGSGRWQMQLYMQRRAEKLKEKRK